MTDPTEPREPEPTVPPMETIADSDRQPPRRSPAHTTTVPRPAPIRTRDDIPPGALAVGAILGTATLILILKWGIPKAIDWYHHQDWAWFTQWTATLADPVHAYLSAHTAGLPLTASSAFVIWQGVGAVSLVLAWFTGAFGARLTYTAHGAATVYMVWASSPAAGRTVAAALAVLAWTIGSLFALRGLSLRPVIVLPGCDRRS
ncbi:hypothetical protein ACH4UM_38550 [Streptomyces sp. NPDC020801]|uniref:hypothetical protein n=1 Tax=Streptomyces sp. NPDC020801 TaxID=3365093 RepID=UPI0037A1B2B4